MIRIQPVIVARAAATTADMFGGRFFLGVGTRENLNEHITGAHWSPASVRQEKRRSISSASCGAAIT